MAKKKARINKAKKRKKRTSKAHREAISAARSKKGPKRLKKEVPHDVAPVGMGASTNADEMANTEAVRVSREAYREGLNTPKPGGVDQAKEVLELAERRQLALDNEAIRFKLDMLSAAYEAEKAQIILNAMLAGMDVGGLLERD